MELNWNLPEMVSGAYAPLFSTWKRPRYIAIKGSRGSGKSEAEARKVIYDIVNYPYVNWLILRRYANTNRQSTFTLLKKVAHKMNVGHLFQFNSSLPEITYKPTGQKILFRGADKPLSITSISVDTGNLCRMWVEEAYQLESEAAFETVDESLRGEIDDPDGYYQTILTFNPWNEGHWLKKRFFDEETREPDSLAFTTTYKDNPFLDEGYVKKLLEMVKRNPRRARVAVFGEWGVTEGLVFENFKVESFDVDKVLKEATAVSYGMDFGFTNDPTTFIKVAINERTKDIYLLDELYKVGMRTDDIERWLKQSGYANVAIRADYSAGGDRVIADLLARGITRIARASKGEIITGIDFLNGYTIHILPSLVHTIEEFNTYAYKFDEKLNRWLNQPIDANNHIIDALRYAVEVISLRLKGKVGKRPNGF